jgi:mannonate dehydratase
MLSRRRFLNLCCAGPLAAAWTRAEAVDTECLRPLPAEFAGHELVQSAFDGLAADQLWDVHAHLVGTGDSGGGAYVDPRTESWMHPVERVRRMVLMAAACVGDAPAGGVDRRYLERLDLLLAAFPPGFRMLLFAFDFTVDDSGQERPEQSTFHTPNAYAAAVARAQPARFGWVASVHPYRPDAIARLEAAAAQGALAIKWLPSAMNIDPASPRCDAFYARLQHLGLPLVIHCGEEVAAPGARQHAFNNPLRVRRPLEAGVRVIVAHAATLGEARDTDALRAGQSDDEAPRVAAFDLFARLMDEPRWEGRLFADLSAVFQRNRTLAVQRALIERSHWHGRLLHGSDYPLPGIGLVYRLQPFVDAGMLDAHVAQTLERLQPLNPLLFEFVLKRTLSVNGSRLSRSVFETRRVFEGRPELGAAPH